MPLRFAILHHTGIPEPHFDVMVETFPGSDLATWRAPVWPIASCTAATRLKDHRRAYLDFEGELSNRRGRVERVAAGNCAVEITAGGIWNIELLSGASPQALRLEAGDGGAWTIRPVD